MATMNTAPCTAARDKLPNELKGYEYVVAKAKYAKLSKPALDAHFTEALRARKTKKNRVRIAAMEDIYAERSREHAPK